MKTFKLALASLFVAALGLVNVNAQTADKAAAPTQAAPAQHLKKDGTPDMRYKENKTAKPATTATPATVAAANAGKTAAPAKTTATAKTTKAKAKATSTK